MYTIAHRGFAHTYPENTLLAIEESSSDSDMVEMDVRETQDGVLVVIHDATLGRVTGVDMSVLEYTFEELQAALPQSGRLFLPTLSEALGVAETEVLLETKGDVDIDAVVSVVQDAEVSVRIQSFYPAHFRELCDKYDGLVGLLIPSESVLDAQGVPESSVTDPVEAATLVEQEGGDFAGVYHKICTAQVVESFHSRGIEVFGWTVRDTETADKLVSAGVDGLISDSLVYIDG